ncbi:MAG: NYN domain-containing protein, partial [Candidatus Thiosymbion ectosymbiont of Robbea hypermnestra]|nr:NYN domain-containing protein [Candidatus Thiosymbion ectosymbiont of Robbea hypermnestra]
MRVAILVDGAFYLRRYQTHFGPNRASDSAQVANDLWTHCIKHLKREDGERLYRIFFYDCPPIEKKLHHPKTNQPIDLAKSPTAIFRKDLHNHLTRKRNVALRLGYLDDKNGRWKIRDPRIERRLISGDIMADELTEADYVYYAVQKGVDMKIGLDIASLSYKILCSPASPMCLPSISRMNQDAASGR